MRSSIRPFSCWAAHPVTTMTSDGFLSFSVLSLPRLLMAFSYALRRTEQVLTTITSASLVESVGFRPALASAEYIFRLSRTFIWQP